MLVWPVRVWRVARVFAWVTHRRARPSPSIPASLQVFDQSEHHFDPVQSGWSFGGGDNPPRQALLHRRITTSRHAGLMRRRHAQASAPRSGFAGFRFPSGVIMVAVRWYLRYGLSYRDVEELLAERGITVDHVTIYRWVQRFTPLLIDAARPCRHAPGDRWFVDETYVKVAGRWVYLYRAIDQFGQIIDVFASDKRDLPATRRFFTRALEHAPRPAEVTTDQAPAYLRVLDELLPAACHVMEQYANNAIENDHGRLKARLRAAIAAVGSAWRAVVCSTIASRSVGRSALSSDARTTIHRVSCRGRWWAVLRRLPTAGALAVLAPRSTVALSASPAATR
jgi:transposase-like protein